MFGLCPSCLTFINSPTENTSNNHQEFAIQSNISPLVPVSPKDYQDRRVKFSPLVPSLIQGTKDQTPELTYKHLEELREKLLQNLREKQEFRVSIGKSKWIPYESFNPAYNLREILNDEVVIEFDTDDRDLSYKAISETAIRLNEAGIFFEVWDHGGKSCHIHIRDLPIAQLEAF